METWTVILHGSRGYSAIHDHLTKDQAAKLIKIAVFVNKDCINFACFCNVK
jgi:translation elongation factor EF-4